MSCYWEFSPLILRDIKEKWSLCPVIFDIRSGVMAFHQLGSWMPESSDRQHQKHRHSPILTSLVSQPIRLLPAPRAWAALPAFCVPALLGVVWMQSSELTSSWKRSLQHLPSLLPDRADRHHQVHRDNPRITLLWGKTHQGSNSTQEEDSKSAICARGNPVTQWWGNSLMNPREV